VKNLLANKKIDTHTNIKTLMCCLTFLALMLTCMHAFAVDRLAGTETDLIDMINGTGKKYLYIGEFGAACLAWFQSRTVKAFFGVLALSVGANVILKMGGVI
jgi:hypothetical protein